MNSKKNILAILFTILFTTVFAHGIWVEITNKGAVGKEATAHLYFGEVNHGVKEKGLKYYEGVMFKDFKAYIKSQGNTQVEALTLNSSKESLFTNFTPDKPGIYQIVAVNEDAPVRDVTKHGLGMLKDNTYLRTTYEATSYREKQEGKVDVSAMMKYDIVPFPAKNGYGEYDSHKSTWRVNERIYATFYIDYKPAANKEIKVVSPDGWIVIKTTNKDGQFNFTPYKSGVHQAIYRDKQSVDGKYKGKKYDTYRVKSVTTLCVE